MADKEVAALSEQRLLEIRERCAGEMVFAEADTLSLEGFGRLHESAPEGTCLPEEPCLGCVGQRYLLLALAVDKDIPDLLAELTRSRAALLEMERERDWQHSRAEDAHRDWQAEKRGKETAVAIATDERNGRLRAEAALLEVERRREELRERVRFLEEGLRRFGQHKPECVINTPKRILNSCNCWLALMLIGEGAKESLSWKARAEAAEQKLAEQRWIPVSEKLPEPGHRVLGLEFGGVIITRSDRMGQFWTEDGRCKVSVELWRELPAAPLVEREG